jgi:hypothetical protein
MQTLVNYHGVFINCSSVIVVQRCHRKCIGINQHCHDTSVYWMMGFVVVWPVSHECFFNLFSCKMYCTITYRGQGLAMGPGCKASYSSSLNSYSVCHILIPCISLETPNGAPDFRGPSSMHPMQPPFARP